MHKSGFSVKTLFLLAYMVFALLPIYWMVNMSFKTNEEILSTFSLLPQGFTLDNYMTIFTDPSWYSASHNYIEEFSRTLIFHFYDITNLALFKSYRADCHRHIFVS